MGQKMVSSLILIVYFVVGGIMASSHNYFEHLSSLKPIASAALAVTLWPLILLGISLHIK
jgi:hypothetical protein